jgi:hypothetical protein
MRNTYFDDNSLVPGLQIPADPPVNDYWDSYIDCGENNTNFKCDDLGYKITTEVDIGGNVNTSYSTFFNDFPFSYSQTIYDNNQNKLKIMDLSNGYYNTDFYNGFTLDYVSSGSDNGNKKRLLYPDLTEERRFIVFKSYSFGSSFISVNDDIENIQNKMALNTKNVSTSEDILHSAFSKFIYPNPSLSGENITITLSPDIKITQYELFNSIGALIEFNTISTQEVNLNLKIAGTYFILIKNENVVIFKEKIIVI